MLVIVDYGVGNLFSLKSSLNYIGAESEVSGEADIIKKADRIILPGVGAFGDAADKLKNTGLGALVCKKAAEGTPIMGICLGMQLLFSSSLEYGVHDGLSLIPGIVRPISEVIPQDLKIPHIGWNGLRFKGKKHPIFKYTPEGSCVYFVHSYYAAGCDDFVIASTEYGAELTAAAARGNVCGCQFHPEKSGDTGLNILRAFCEWDGEAE